MEELKWIGSESLQQIIDTEQSIIVYLLENPIEIIPTSTYLKSNHFSLEQYARIYEALIQLTLEGRTVDPVQLQIELDKNNWSKICGSDEILSEIFGGGYLGIVVARSSFWESTCHLVEKHKRQDLYLELDKLKKHTIDPRISLNRLREKVTGILEGFLEDSIKPEGGLKHISETLEGTLKSVTQRAAEKKQGIVNLAIPTGFSDLDRHTGGWRGGNLIILAGRPGMGKSALAANFLLNIATDKPVALFSLEMSQDELNERYLSIESGVQSRKMRDGDLLDNEVQKLSAAMDKLVKLKFWGSDNFSPSIDVLIGECRRLQAREGQIGAVCLDYLQLLVQNPANEVAELTEITRKLKLLASELKCPVFGLSQLNRSLEGRNDKRPIMSDLRGCGSIEQDANIVIAIYRDEVYNPRTPDQGVAELIFRKFRNGSEGTIKLVFDGSTTKFKNLATF